VLIGSCVLEAGCTGRDSGSPEGAATSATVDGVSFRADLNQSRPQEGTRQINAHLTNTGDDAVTVTSVKLVADQFEPLPATPKDSTFVPGQTIDLVSEYGDPTCDEPRISIASFTLTLADGSSQMLPVNRHGLAWLNRLYVDECNLRAINEVASISYGPELVRTIADGEPALLGSVLIQRQPDAPDEPLTIRTMRGSVLIDFVPAEAGALPATLGPNQQELSIPILFEAFRCDQHAIADSTQTFILSVYAQRGDGPQQRVILVPDKRRQAQIFAMTAAACATRER
jgi:hypothetical protein